jgi:hypothetical protein
MIQCAHGGAALSRLWNEALVPPAMPAMGKDEKLRHARDVLRQPKAAPSRPSL